ncbi:FKBP-type peptidyl-prolyl cis-trans isomerase [Acidimicrobiaceae bacterium AH-315-P05]|nr:FKBP-type peptidyl-prolyl cis-trans isomerase [Acidimicrobiaceae bacterium AH-315-P05]
MAALLIAVALVAAACASADDDATPVTTTAPADQTTAPETTTVDDEVIPTPPGGEVWGEKPVVVGRSDSPPTELVINDLIVGDGDTATAGNTVVVQYVGVRYEDGVQFDASWDRGQPFEFVLGVGQVISGWDQGFDGMQVGGRRELLIPSGLAYGDRGAGADIPPGQALIFVVDMIEVVSPFPEPFENSATRVVVPNQGGVFEGTALSVSEGVANSLFVGDELSPDIPEGEGLEAWISFGLEDVADTLTSGAITAVTLRSQAMLEVVGDPFVELGNITATFVDNPEFPPNADAKVAAEGGDSVICVADPDAASLTCDVAELVADAAANGADRVSFVLKFDTPSDTDGEPDIAFFFITDQQLNDVGIFTLEFALS